MIDALISSLAPHYCCSCGVIGAILCDHCKYDIVSEVYDTCIVCGASTARDRVCSGCKTFYERAWCVGERSGALQRLIGGFKFQNMHDAHRPLADLLLDTVELLPPETIVVPIPTVNAHIRQRGYDHTLLIARRFAKKRGLRLDRSLRRATTTKQRDAGRKRRIEQAKKAFRVEGGINADVPYLLVDDVITTGATVQYAAKTLRDAGVRKVWVAAIARQPLDE